MVQDEQRFDTLMDEEPDDGSFMLHYNFPPFASGEVKPMRGTSRRETGHGYLARSAFNFYVQHLKHSRTLFALLLIFWNLMVLLLWQLHVLQLWH